MEPSLGVRTGALCILGALLGCHPRTAGPVPAPPDACRAQPGARDGQKDFDFEFGAWTAHLSRRQRPLTGSSAWVAYEGTSVVRRVWGGRANLGELDVEGPAGRIQGLTLRLYDPALHQWSIRFANSRDGDLSPPMAGGFDGHGRGEFFSRETFEERPICVRFIFSEITGRAFRFEQAFSADDGQSWETNWVATFSRVDG
jgi:hypothetical protein